MFLSTLLRRVAPALLMCCAFGSQAVVTLEPGQSFQTSFSLQSDGQYFLSTDFFWEAQLQAVDSAANVLNTGTGTGTLTVLLFENIDFTNLVYTASIDSSSAAFGTLLGGSFAPAFSDLSGSLRISYAGTGTAELQSITVSNSAGTQGPFFNATTTFEPVGSPVPWPPALALLLPGLLVTAAMASRKKRAALTG